MGWVEAPRGSLSHWVRIENGQTVNYQAVVPSTWNSSGRDAAGQMGPYEYSLAHTGKHPLVDPSRPVEPLRTITAMTRANPAPSICLTKKGRPF